MKATPHIHRTLALGLSTLLLSSVLLFSVACTRGNGDGAGGTTAGTSTGTPAVTTPATSGQNSTGSNTARPMDPDAGTVNPDGDAGDPPTATDDGHESRSFRSHFMH